MIANDSILTEISPDRLAAAVEENAAAFPPVFGLLGEYYADDPPGVKRSITPYRNALFNMIAGARLDAQDVDPAIHRVVDDARTRGVPIRWWIGPQARPLDLGDRLLAHGFTFGSEDPGMAVDLAKLNEDLPVPEDFTIRRAEDEAGYRLWAEWMLRGFGVKEPGGNVEPWSILLRRAGLERLQGYTGFLAGKPVTSSLLFLGAGAAGIYCVCTLPEARRKGTGARITLAPLLEARRMGYRVGVLMASQDGFPVYRRLGFETVCKMRFYDRG